MNSNMTVSPKGTLVGRGAVLSLTFSRLPFRLIFAAVWSAGILSLIYLVALPVWLAAFNDNSFQIKAATLGLARLFAGLFFAYLPVRLFFRQKVSYPKVIALAEASEAVKAGRPFNLFAVFSLELAKMTARLFAGPTHADSGALARALLKSTQLNFVLVRLAIDRSGLEKRLDGYSSRVDGAEVVARSFEVALAESHHQIEVGDVFVALCQADPVFQALLAELKLEVADVANVVYWQTNLIRKSLEGRRFLDPGRFRFSGGIGRDWAYGFTPLLNKYGLDLTRQVMAGGLNLEVVGREKEIEQIEESLGKSGKGGVVLVGEAGIGKRTTVLGLARRIATGQSGQNLAFKHVFEINIDSLLSDTHDTLEKLNRLFAEVRQAGNAIMVIENIQNLLKIRSAGLVEAAEMLVSYLDQSGVKLIGTLDVANYNQYVAANTALSERLDRVTVTESNEVETVRILEDTVPIIESRTGAIVSYEAIKETVKLAGKYIVDTPNPEKSISLLDGAVAHAASKRRETIITPEDVMAYITYKYEIPSGQANEGEKQKLLSLEDKMRRRIVGQEEAIKAIAGAMKRARAGVVNSKKPIGSFLFLGPTGVGKTETAKALAESYFGSAENMVRFDMSEFQNQADIYRLIGSGGNQPGMLTTAVREHPFSLLLFDEIEKANRNILDLFLQILDEGHLTDGSGRKVIFTNTIIICTSNAGADLIRQSIGSNVGYESVRKVLLDQIQKQNIYRPEFLNRFTQIVIFSPLSEADIAKIAGLMLAKVAETVKKTRRIDLEIAPEAVAYLARLGFDPQMGARPMARVIEEKIENLLAEKILSGKIEEGKKIVIGLLDIKGGE